MQTKEHAPLSDNLELKDEPCFLVVLWCSHLISLSPVDLTGIPALQDKQYYDNLGPVVQSIVSLMSLLVDKMLTVLVSTISEFSLGF